MIVCKNSPPTSFDAFKVHLIVRIQRHFLTGIFTLLLSLYSGWMSVHGQTIGLVAHSPEASEGYVLLSPVASNKTFLIDQCGRQVNVWESDRNPAQSAYLMPDGRLWRTGKLQGSFFSGGVGGSIQIFEWDGNLVWDYPYATDDFQQHHDIEPLENGHVLLIAWEHLSEEEALAHGRDSNWINERGLWPEQIVEVRPNGFSSGEIVWKWSAKDHLIQDFDSTKLNFGTVADHPELIDLNYGRRSDPPLAIADWIHANSIDYHPEWDQIMISSRKFNEIWIIDHSTTILEAAGHEGGRYGKGGDLLYRWGNPAAYRRGEADNQQLFGQHDAHWVKANQTWRDHILIFNNGFERPNGMFSSIVLIDPMTAPNGSYEILAEEAFGPSLTTWTIADPELGFDSPRMSGVQLLPEGQLVICAGNSGTIIELDSDRNSVWRYVNPILGSSPGRQGSTPRQNALFHAPFYGADFLAFDGRDLTPGSELEIDPLPNPCLGVHVDESSQYSLTIINPAIGRIQVRNDSNLTFDYLLFSCDLSLLLRGKLPPGHVDVGLNSIVRGVYLMVISDQRKQWLNTYRVVVF